MTTYLDRSSIGEVAGYSLWFRKTALFYNYWHSSSAVLQHYLLLIAFVRHSEWCPYPLRLSRPNPETAGFQLSPMQAEKRLDTRSLTCRPGPFSLLYLTRPSTCWKTDLSRPGYARGSGEIGRHTILRGWRPKGMGVQVPPSAPSFFQSFNRPSCVFRPASRRKHCPKPCDTRLSHSPR
jgi:hypothetical protein